MKRIKELREQYKITQNQIEQSTGISRSLLSRYEKGTRIPPIDNIIKLADLFNVSIDYLAERTDDPTFIKKTGSGFIAATENGPDINRGQIPTKIQKIRKDSLPRTREELSALVQELLSEALKDQHTT